METKREIKFRVWIPRLKKMEEVSSIEWYHNENNVRVNDVTSRGMIIKDTWELMQFTGFKDKNGIEIYEGDIVSFPFAMWYGENVKYNYHNCEVIFADEFHGWGIKIGNSRYTFGSRDEFLLLGNIYENPELLKI